jgi:hypothetical protein
MGRFTTSIRGLSRSESISISDIDHWFDQDNIEGWEIDLGWNIQYKTPDRSIYSLILNYNGSEGVSIIYDCYGRENTSLNKRFYAQHVQELDNDFVILENGEMVPGKTAIPLATAREIVSSFILDPTHPPKNIKWRDHADFRWPHDY